MRRDVCHEAGSGIYLVTAGVPAPTNIQARDHPPDTQISQDSPRHLQANTSRIRMIIINKEVFCRGASN